MIKPIIVRVEDMSGEEHLYCDKEQLNAEGKFRRPKKLQEAERKGFNSVMEMDNADKKAEEDKKTKEQQKMIDDLKKQLTQSQQEFQAERDLLLRQGQEAQRAYDASERRFNDYKQTMEARFEAERDTTIRRFDKLATMLQSLGGSK